MAAVTLRGNFRHIDPATTSIVLIEGGNRILPTFAESLSREAARRLEKLGVKDAAPSDQVSRTARWRWLPSIALPAMRD